jgi:LacI family transcriptional regulator
MATIKDVAREAGVSTATVSRVFNGSGLVSEGTRRQVSEVAARLRYWPNGVARSLITQRTHVLGVLLPDLYGEFYSEVIRGLDLAARGEGFHLLVSSSHADTAELMDAVRSMRGRIDGLIVMAPDVDAPAALEVSGGNFPMVLIDPGVETTGFDTISIANFEGAYAMTRHLAKLGHRRIAIVAGPQRNADARQRLEGYRAALRDLGLPIEPGLEYEGDFTEPSGYAAVKSMLDERSLPGAIFASNDYMAVGVMEALSDAGVRVPEQAAVTGFDDIVLARHLNPPLTTVHVDAFGLGRRAIERLLIRQRAPSILGRHRELIRTTLAIRASCGAAGDARKTGSSGAPDAAPDGDPPQRRRER